MFGKSLKAVLNEYREAHAPNTTINREQLSEGIGFFTAQYVGVKPENMTDHHKKCKRAVVTLTRCRRLLDVIEKYERV